jgi:hypothetical protein
VLFLGSACHDSTGPLRVPSTFVVRTVNDSSVPAPVISHEAFESVLLADTIHFYPLGIARRISIYRNTGIDVPTTIDTSRVQESYVVRGDSVRFQLRCPPNALCVGAPEGIFSADRRQLLLRFWPGGPVALYDRVTPSGTSGAASP